VRLTVIGDAIEDEVVDLEVLHEGAEGQPTYREVRRRLMAGGAANVAKHCARLGAHVYLVHSGKPETFKDDLTLRESLQIMQNYEVGQGSGPRAVIRKTRYYCGDRKVLKVNHPPECETQGPDVTSQMLLYGHTDAVLACDNGHGFFNQENAQELVRLCDRRSIPLFVDCQASSGSPCFERWFGANSVFVNKDEAEHLGAACSRFENVHYKCGFAGSRLVNRSTPPYVREVCGGYSVKVVDAVGAGDAYMAAWAVHGNLNLANAWAALSCKRRGTELPELSEIGEIDASLARYGEP
jgi:sugar/nucleoside kinase (ribokinase family)